MIKILSVKLLILLSLFFIVPVSVPLFAQDDGGFEMEDDDWTVDSDDDPFINDLPAKNTLNSERSESPVKPQPAKKVAPKRNVGTTNSYSPPKAEKVPHKTVAPVAAPVKSKPKKVFEPVKQTRQEYNVGKTVKRAGPPLLLIARPVYAPYSNEDKTMYISAIAEAYFHFKLGALPGIQVIPLERIANNVQYFRDFTRRISRTTYIDAAKKLGATYLFYQEYEPKGKKVAFATELYSIADNKKIAGSTSDISLSDFENGLFDFVNEAAGALVGTLPQQTQELLAAPVMGKSSRQIEQLGDAIVSVGEYSLKNTEKASPEFEKLAKDHNMYLAKYIGAQILARAHLYDKAIDLQQKLYATFGDQYPGLSLQLAAFYRMAKSYDKALQATNSAAREPTLALVARIEKARIYEAQGQLEQAKREYESVLSEGGEDGEIYLQLAMVSISLKNLQKAEYYLKKAAAAGRQFDKSDYFELGLRYEALGTATEQAIKAFRNCLGIQQDNVEAWQKLAEIYSAAGREADAAECYVSLFQINNNTFKDYLFKAGTMFESSGYLENAKDAYSLYLARRFTNPEVNVRLAKLEMQSGNCKRAIELVDNMDTTGTFGMDVTSINSQCGKEERRVVIPTGTVKKGWRAVFFWRLSSSAVLVGAGVLTFLMDNAVKEAQEQYNGARNQQTVEDTRAKLKSAETTRNLCYLGVGIGVTNFALSIAVPIVFSDNK